MKIDNHHTVTRDTHCWTLRREIPTGNLNDKGEEIISKNHTYHATLSQALKVYCDEKMGDCETIDEVRHLINLLELKIDKINNA